MWVTGASRGRVLQLLLASVGQEVDQRERVADLFHPAAQGVVPRLGQEPHVVVDDDLTLAVEDVDQPDRPSGPSNV